MAEVAMVVKKAKHVFEHIEIKNHLTLEQILFIAEQYPEMSNNFPL